MKLRLCLIGFALLAASWMGFGANPSYSDFIGTGGITVTSNPPPAGNGKITIDGSGISAGALPTYAVTNNQTTSLNFASNLRIGGTVTNVGAVYLQQARTNSLMVVSPIGQLTNAFKIIRVETNQSHILSNIVFSASSGDIVQLGVGAFNIGAQSIVMPEGVSLIGSGMDRTFISGTNDLHSPGPGPLVIIRSTNVVMDMTILLANTNAFQAGIGFDATLGNGHLAATNFYIQRVRILDGQTDGFYFIHSNYFSGTIRDCIVNAKWDAYVQSTPALGTCTNYVEIWNSSFTIDHTNTVFTSAIGADMHPIRVSNGTLVLNNCDLVCTNGKSATALVMGGTRGTTIYLNQSRVNVAGTNGAGTYYKFDNALLPVTWNLVANSSGILDADGKPGSIATFLNAGFASITATNTVTVTNYDGSYTYISSQGAFGDNAGQWQVGNFNGPLLQFLTSGNTVRPTGTPYPSLGDSTRPYDGIFATNITTKKTITLGGITASRALMVNASGNVTNVTSSDPANEFVHADGTTGTASGGFTVGSFIQVSGVSNHVENTFSASSVNTLYGTNQMWRTYATSNLTYAVSGLRSNVLYWMLHTNNTSTITVPATWQWPFEPNYAAPSMTGGRYIVILLLNDQGTNAWLQEAPTFQLVPGQNMVFTTNAATATVTVSTSLTPTFTTSTLTNGLILMATNANVALLRVANSNAAPVTNILGFLEKASGSPIICDANDGNNFFLTNRVTAATTIVSTNTAPGQEMTFLVIGEASGGSARTITFIPKLGNLVANLDVFGTALAVSSTGFSFSLTNGNAVEVSERIVRLNGTNMSLFISRQFAF